MLIEWLRTEVASEKLLTFMLKSAALTVILSSIGVTVMLLLSVDISSNTATLNDLAGGYHPRLREILVAVLLVAILEEMIFRAPLYLFVVWGGPRIATAAALVSSILFGWMHGGFGNIPIQGIGGIIFCIVFFKCGAMQRKFIRGLSSSITTHFLIDAFIYSLIFWLSIQ